jgi:hypothetical protein
MAWSESEQPSFHENAMQALSRLEQAVLDKLLSGAHPVLLALRPQVDHARVTERELTGVGFFCSLEIPAHVPPAPGSSNVHIGDVHADIEGLAHGAGFVLFIRDGRLSMLEGYTFDEPWPRDIGEFRLTYTTEPRDLRMLGGGD